MEINPAALESGVENLATHSIASLEVPEATNALIALDNAPHADQLPVAEAPVY